MRSLFRRAVSEGRVSRAVGLAGEVKAGLAQTTRALLVPKVPAPAVAAVVVAVAAVLAAVPAGRPWACCNWLRLVARCRYRR